MFLLSLIPTSLLVWMVDALLGLGIIVLIAGYALKFLPKITGAGAYAIPLQLLGIVMLTAGVYFKGGTANELEHRDRVEKLEAKIRESEAKSDDLNGQLISALKSKQKTVKEVQFIVQEKIVEVAGKIDSKCEVDPSAVELLNMSAKNKTGKK